MAEADTVASLEIDDNGQIIQVPSTSKHIPREMLNQIPSDNECVDNKEPTTKMKKEGMCNSDDLCLLKYLCFPSFYSSFSFRC